MSRIALIPLLAAVACSSLGSSDIETSGIHADLWVSYDGGQVSTANALLKVGGETSTTFVELQDPDSIAVSSTSGTTTLSAIQLGSLWTYVANTGDTSEDDMFTFALDRPNGTSAPDSTVSLPAPFTMIATASLSRATEPLVVSWGPAGAPDPVRLNLHSACLTDPAIELYDDPGTYTFTPGSYAMHDDVADQACDVTVEVHRVRDGTLDAAFGSGAAYAEQVRSVDIVLEP